MLKWCVLFQVVQPWKPYHRWTKPLAFSPYLHQV
jgi:hypothetical protein